ncbi:hypothetical protein [Tuberibacillus sp. Marseille-P3662]|uniref:hypothetical protein n=1 Tax=Tuberibacillus sp. Marseille-P3662 TaxID=1965358 RepID=UPI000A1CB76C|nr:hypothetical protein [Tuberibacillus sp. Marseille-P3662]
MGFAVFCLASWLIIVIFALIPKKFSIVENTFVFLILLILTINVSWIVFEEMSLIKETQEGMKHVSFLLNRSVIIPMTLITQLNLVYRTKTFTGSLLTMMASLVFLLIMRGFSLYFNIITYVKWNFGYDVIYLIVMYVITFFALYLFRKLTHGEVDVS